jgi:hypothetical protein
MFGVCLLLAFKVRFTLADTFLKNSVVSMTKIVNLDTSFRTMMATLIIRDLLCNKNPSLNSLWQYLK